MASVVLAEGQAVVRGWSTADASDDAGEVGHEEQPLVTRLRASPAATNAVRGHDRGTPWARGVPVQGP
jgi:hypothetical protein